MALSAATHRTQDVAFNSFRQETSPEPEPEEVAEERPGDGDEEKDEAADAAPKEEDHDKDAPSSRRGSDISEVEEARAPTSASGKFTLGIEDGSEFLDELSFSLQHCRDQEAAGAAVEGQPPPGHWVSQPHGEETLAS